VVIVNVWEVTIPLGIVEISTDVNCDVICD
jgi:hypothetical protein